jgi:pimeloyl-ACP methyl ester carboxylesterase
VPDDIRLTKAGAFTVEYLDAGAGPAVVLLHSSASGYRQWHGLIEELRGRYRFLAVNLFGYGATSAWPGHRPLTLADQAALVVAVIAETDEPVVILGHSLGGAVALQTALVLPDRLQAVIVFEPILFDLLRTQQCAGSYAEIHDVSVRYGALARAGLWDEAGEAFVDYWSGAGAWAAMSADRKAGLRAMLPNVLHEWDAVITEGSAPQDWRAVTVPVSLLHAADTRRPPRDIATILAEMNPHWTLHELAEGGHTAPLVRPDIANPLMANILADVESAHART